MGKRTSLSKTLRFEVFKRDKFTCQYCGRMAPDVVLEVDHIKPVSKGGTNEMLNLITSCFDCNRGKKAKVLSDNTVVLKQQEQVEILMEKKAQIEMLIDYKTDLADMDNFTVNKIDDYFCSLTGRKFTSLERTKIKNYLKVYSLEDLLKALELSTAKYSDETIVDKAGAIAYNRKHPASAVKKAIRFTFYRLGEDVRDWGNYFKEIMREVDEMIETPEDMNFFQKQLWKIDCIEEIDTIFDELEVEKECRDGNL